MKRPTDELGARTYDVLVIGAGIYGSSVARDAALRGLTVALIDRDDFGAATSANSLKIIHGGLRYLQDANLQRVRAMVGERKAWLRIAPHLVHPLACLMPTYSGAGLARHKLALAAAVKGNDLLSLDRNRAMDAGKRLPAARVIGRRALLALQPQLDGPGLSGAIIWHDAHVHNTERLLLGVIRSAAAEGACTANYLAATGFLRQGDRIVGVRADDALSGATLEIRARVTVNATGASVDSVAGLSNGRRAQRFRPSLALNLVTRQLWPGDYAVAVHSRPPAGRQLGARAQTLFIVPWRDCSVIGTLHARHEGATLDRAAVREQVEALLQAVNSALPDVPLAWEDVRHIQAGLLPMRPDSRASAPVRLVREGRVHDHKREDGLDGLITVVGVKYTTARKVAEQAVNLVERKLGRPPRPAQTAVKPIQGGDIAALDAFLAEAVATRPPSLTAGAIEHLVLTYGTEYRHILDYVAADARLGQSVGPGTPVTRAEVVHAVREEMAQTLCDVVLRRTELGSAGPPPAEIVASVSRLVQSELGWSEARRQREVEELYSAYLLAEPGLEAALE